MTGQSGFDETIQMLARKRERLAWRRIWQIWAWIFLRLFISSSLLIWAVNALFNLGIPLTGENVIGGVILVLILGRPGTDSHAK